MPGISNTPRIISPLESPQNGIQPGSLLEVFPTLRTSPYFFPVPFMMKETFSKTYSERYKIHSVPFYRGFVKTITAARPQTMRGTIWDNTHQVPALCATQVKSWAGTTPEEERQLRRCRRYRGRSSATNIKNPRCRGTSSATSEYTKYK